MAGLHAAHEQDDPTQHIESVKPIRLAEPVNPGSDRGDGVGGLLWGLALTALATVVFLVANGPHVAPARPTHTAAAASRDALSPILQSIEAMSQRELDPPAERDSHARQVLAAAKGVAAGTLAFPEIHQASSAITKALGDQEASAKPDKSRRGQSRDAALGKLDELGELGKLDELGELDRAQGDADGESAFPAGTGQPAPFQQEGSATRQPLQRSAGKYAVLWTDARPEYASELLGRLDSFLTQAHAEMGRVLDVQVTAKPVQIYVFESQERYQEYAREHAPGLVNNGGFYDGGMRTVVTYRYNNSMQLYFHEMVHAMMGEQFADHNFTRYTRRHWPIWFDEGIAEYLGSFELLGRHVQVPAVNKGKLAYLVNAMANRAFIDLPTLLKAPAERFSGPSMNIYYAESWGLLDFLLSSPTTRPKVAQFFKKIKAGEDGLGAFRSCFGDNLPALDSAWRSYLSEKAKVGPGTVQLFSGETIDDWTIHEGGQWKAGGGEISGQGDRNYNYLIKSELPSSEFTYQLDVNLSRGTAGLILGNNFHGEYPYYYLIEIARDVVMVRRAWSASHIEPVIQAYAELPPSTWVQVRATIQDRVLRLSIGGREVLQTRVDRERYSLFGLYLYRAKVRFRNISLLREASTPAWSSLPAAPAGGPPVSMPQPPGAPSPLFGPRTP
jgi:hypothetical protein